MTSTDPTADMFQSLAGQRIPGGCDDCDAYQTLDNSQARLYRINVHHDDWCPTYRGHLNRKQRRAKK